MKWNEIERKWTGLEQEDLDDHFHQLLLRDSENH